MTAARYVLLALPAGSRSAWHREVGRWATTGAIPAEWVTCLSIEEVRARLRGGRPFSALLVDAVFPRLDRDLICTAKAAGCAVLVVGDGRGREWVDLGAAGELPIDVARDQLIELLSRHARLIGRADHLPDRPRTPDRRGTTAPLVAVTGPGGTGASTVAIAVAQGCAALYRPVLLADLRRHAEMGVLHEAGDVVPSVQELVSAFRTGRPTTDQVRALTFGVPQRGYDLLLGLPRETAWPSIRPRAFESALDGLRRVNRVVVADVDADLEGEEDGGSVDVEERNLMARTVCARAQAVFVVGAGGVKGLHALARVVGGLLRYGVPGGRIVPVVNRAPLSVGLRADITSSLVGRWEPAQVSGPVFLPEERADDALHEGIPLPEAMTVPLVGALHTILRRVDLEQPEPDVPRRVAPGRVGAWSP